MRRVTMTFKVTITLLLTLVLPCYAEEKRFPPYPDVWGYELPWPEETSRNCTMRLAKMPDGDYLVTYVKRWDESKYQIVEWGGVFFFANRSTSFLRGEYGEFWEKNRHREIRSPSAVLADESVVKQVQEHCGRCCPRFETWWIEKRDKTDVLIFKKMLLYLYGQPQKTLVNHSCPQGNEYYSNEFYEKEVDNMVVSFVPLEDGTFLAYDPSGNMVIRFDSNLGTKFPQLDRSVFVVDRGTFEDVNKQVLEKRKFDEPSLDNALANYLKIRKQGGVK